MSARPAPPAQAGELDLTPLLAPRSVAVVGATERPGAYGSAVLRNLAASGFPGPVWAVNPGRDSVLGRECVPDLAALPEAVDAVVIAIPAPGVPAVLAAAGARGCGGAIVMSAGFGETADGRALETELRDVARACRLPVCGPNGNGIVSVTARAPLWGDLVADLDAGPVAIISESGNFAVNALASTRGLRFHTVVSCGNGAVLAPSDWIDALARMGGVRSIALMLESDGDGPALARALARCAEHRIGVSVLKVGRSAGGARAAGAHTGALAGDQRVFTALLREAGAAVAHEPAELLELARALAQPRARLGGGRIRGAAILTCSGGDSGIAADLAHDRGLPLPALAPATQERLSRVLPAAATPANPLDYTSMLWEDRAALSEVAAAVAGDPGIDQLIVLFDQPPGLGDADAADWRAVRAALLAGAREGDGAVLVGATLPELLDPVALDELDRAGVAVAAGLGATIAAAAAMRAPPGDPARLEAIAAAAEVGRAVGAMGAGAPAGVDAPAGADAPAGSLGEAEVKRLLRDGGLAVPPGATATGAPAAVAAANDLDYPVALKLSSPSLLHKTEAGALELDLGDPAAVRAAAERLLDLPAAAGATLLVERMAAPGVELFFAVRRDGIVPVLAVGAGGTWAELLDDVALVVLPADPTRVLTALRELRAADRWDGARGGRPVDLEPAARFGARLGELALAHDLELLEVNPARLGPGGCVALDAVARRALRRG